MKEYNYKEIEKKWRKRWQEENVYQTTEDADKEKFYILDMFPYPSGAGLHVGHPKGFIATDIISRFKKMKGFNVLHPMGWDAFGLPAEQYALKNKIHPQIGVKENIDTFKKQLEKISLNYDWEREFSTTDPEFYKWTQWTFLQMFKKGLVYQSNEPINWCPSCKTGLANEDLENGCCERCDTPIEKKKIPQWIIKITDYADRILADLDKLDWQEHIKELQRNWIGRSEGAKIKFAIKNSEEKIEIFTTRPDTLFGATYMVLAPEHELLEKLKNQISNFDEVGKYQKEASKKTEIERTAEGKEKTGVELKGIKAINPANNEEIPIYIADYVMADYGTGAIMAVPAHDERDNEFAKKFNIENKKVIATFLQNPNVRADKETFQRNAVYGIVRNPKNNKYLCLDWKIQDWNAFPAGGIKEEEDLIEAAKREIQEETGYKNLKFFKKDEDKIYENFYRPHKGSNVFVNFRAVFFDLIDDEQEEVLEKEREKHEAIWLEKEEVKNFLNVAGVKLIWERYLGLNKIFTENGILINSGKFDGMKSEEAKKAITEFVGGEMTTSYKLRDWVFSRQRYWGEPIPLIHCEKCGVVAVPEDELPLKLPEVESYEPTGTGESPLAAIDEWVNTKCPECGGDGKRETNTMPNWAGSSWYYLRYIDPKNKDALVDKEKEKYWSPVDFYVGGAEHATRHLIYARFWHKFLYDIGAVSYEEPFKKLQTVGLIMAEDGRKMSKRWGNVINPDDMIDRFGADTFRLYEMFMGPFDATVAWNTDGMIGPYRFLERILNISEFVSDKEESDKKITKLLHKTIKKVEGDISDMKYNTAISFMMVLSKEIEKNKNISKKDFLTFLKILSPFAPHLTQELWQQFGNDDFLLNQEWPKYDEELAKDDKVTMGVQFNGKRRGEITVAVDISEEEIMKQVQETPEFTKWLEGEIVKVVFVPGKILNIVVK